MSLSCCLWPSTTLGLSFCSDAKSLTGGIFQTNFLFIASPILPDGLVTERCTNPLSYIRCWPEHEALPTNSGWVGIQYFIHDASTDKPPVLFFQSNCLCGSLLFLSDSRKKTFRNYADNKPSYSGALCFFFFNRRSTSRAYLTARRQGLQVSQSLLVRDHHRNPMAQTAGSSQRLMRPHRSAPFKLRREQLKISSASTVVSGW